MPIYSFVEGNGDHHSQPMNERERERETMVKKRETRR